MNRTRKLLAMGVALLATAGCNASSEIPGGSASPDGCTEVAVATSPEKLDLFTELAQTFNDSDDNDVDGRCSFVSVKRVSSGVGASALVDGWTDESNGPKPVVWSPAASSWGAIVNERLSRVQQTAIVPSDPKPFMLTPLVIAMPKPMAEALGHPATPIGFGDLLQLSGSQEGWASKGHPEWGAFKLGKTNPNFSTSGLSSTIAQYYAATGKQSDLTLEDVNRPDVDTFMRGVESAVVHYGDTTLSFLNNMYRNDRAGLGLTYVSAVAVEETSIIAYNRGNPDGVLDPGEQPRPPRIPLVAVYPKDGTLFSDNPFFVLNAPWVTAAEKKAARLFETFVQRPANQKRVLDFGFRPGNPSVKVTDPISKKFGVDASQPGTTLGVPEPEVLVRLIEKWGEQRKAARVQLVIDVSGSMGEEVSTGETKLDLAKRASIEALSQFKPEDIVGLRIFSTNVSPREPAKDFIDLVPFGKIADNRELIAGRIRSLTPIEGTPLYATAKASVEEMKKAYDPARINAVVLLTDGRNEDDYTDLDATLASLRAGSEGQSSTPVRLFTIAYGSNADKSVLKRLAEATNAGSYDATDPLTVTRVFTAVISNF